MILVNTTFVVDSLVEAQFVEWVRQEWLPAMRATRRFASVGFLRVLGGADPHSTNYAVQGRCHTLDEAIRWADNVSEPLRRAMAARWGEKVLPFTTYMQNMPLS